MAETTTCGILQKSNMLIVKGIYNEKEFVALEKRVEDAEDLLDLHAAQKEEQHSPTIDLSELEKEFGIH